jgi:glycosyltransferase involved in cell wall biosynthesis
MDRRSNIKDRCYISIVLVVFNMRREAPRTLYSLSCDYQREVDIDDYEIIVIENGSTQALSSSEVCSFGSNFRYHYHSTTSRSPADALNIGVNMAKGEHVLLLVDGARILSPGVIAGMQRMVAAFSPQPAFIATLGWHLGPDVQMKSIHEGYDRQVEDRLLDSVAWRDNGYELFTIASFAGSNSRGWFMPISESPCLCLPKSQYLRLGGFETRFNSPGGGLVNLDFFERALAVEEMAYVILLGEGSFHQVHGGASTNAPVRVWEDFEQEYKSIRNRSYAIPHRQAQYFGSIPPQCYGFMRSSLNEVSVAAGGGKGE